ncbi:NAD-binding protein [Pyrrhoderma noxium]|uniref:NAD-binding protein n=1 Tax=Pyrrhoderma noxium TaxID=2282107 RepID=A0A286UDI8_9AGAM|nr:NAD-binding protein [Pyrrhoderma noxium]
MALPAIKKKIFFTGATGYIGGSVLWRLLNHSDCSSFTIKALFRDRTKANRFQDEFSVESVVGNLSELKKLETLASEADYIFTTANIVDYSATLAILKGMKKHNELTGKRPVLIQTSGTAVLDDDADGMYVNEKVYDDANIEEIEALPLSQPHRLVDSTVVAADEEGYARTYIIFPSTVYGIAKNRLTESGLQNPYSIQIPYLIRAALDRGQGGVVGLGKNMWPNVHIDDQADLYLRIFDKCRENPDSIPHGRAGLYLTESGEHILYDVCKRIAETLFSLGLVSSPEVTSFSQEERLKYFGDGPDFFGTNSRCIASRARSIGWNPKHSTADLMASIRPEIEEMIRLQTLKYTG